MPWNALNTINWIIVCASAHAKEKTRKTARANNMTTFLPNTSDQRPYNGVDARLYGVRQDTSERRNTLT